MTVLAAFLLAHTATRFGGLWVPALIPLSMVLVWPMPWTGSLRAHRSAVGFRRCRPGRIVWGAACGVVAAAACAIVAWAVYGLGELNWFNRHAVTLGAAAAGMPGGLSVTATFWFLTLPALIFSPTAEEILFRGYLQRELVTRYGDRSGVMLQATGFAVIHLAHYGLRPWQPGLIPVWLLSMYSVGWALGVVRQRTGSLWPAMAMHAGFNLCMNAVTFWWFPAVVGLP